MSSIDNTTGEIRPNATTSSAPACPAEWRLVREQTLIKRLRRRLASLDLVLHRNRPGTSERERYGEWSVSGRDCGVMWHNVTLVELARDMRVLAADERIEPHGLHGWRYFVGLAETVNVAGIPVSCIRPIAGRTYVSEAAARRAVEHLEGRAGLVVVGFDAASRQEDVHGE